MEEKEQGPKKSDGNSICGGGWWGVTESFQPILGLKLEGGVGSN